MDHDDEPEIDQAAKICTPQGWEHEDESVVVARVCVPQYLDHEDEPEPAVQVGAAR